MNLPIHLVDWHSRENPVPIVIDTGFVERHAFGVEQVPVIDIRVKSALGLPVAFVRLEHYENQVRLYAWAQGNDDDPDISLVIVPDVGDLLKDSGAEGDDEIKAPF